MLRQTLTDPAFIAQHRQREQDFTRQRALTFSTVVAWLLLNFQNSMRQALQRLLDAQPGQLIAVTKGALSQARGKLKDSALVALNRLVLAEAESALPQQGWMGHRLLAVDGSSLRLPESAEFINAFGGSRHRRGMRPLARVSMILDVFNRLVVSAALAPWKAGERALFAQHFDALRVGDLVLLDRGYPALWLFAVLQARGVHFCARLDPGLWRATVDLARHGTEELGYSASLNRRALALCEQLGVPVPPSLRLRVLRVRLDNGTDEYLVTSLLDCERYPRHLFRDLYARRWAVEEAFKQLKARLTAENLSGKSELAVRQDFHARVFLANLVNLFALESDRRIRKDDKARQRQHPHQTNRHYALAQLRHFLPRFLMNPTRRIVHEILQRFASEAEAIRPGRSFPRTPPRLHREFSIAYKPVA